LHPRLQCYLPPPMFLCHSPPPCLTTLPNAHHTSLVGEASVVPLFCRVHGNVVPVSSTVALQALVM
jgi:hypothetical protein